MDLSINLLGLKFDNPLGPASGPLSGNIENLRFFNDNKCGVIVTKTFSVEGAQVDKPCMMGTDKLVYNCELWSEYHSSKWVDEILPQIHHEKKKPLIVSVGYKGEDFERLIPLIDDHVDFYEISTHYGKDSLENIVKAIRRATHKPIFMKLSPHIEDYLGFVDTVIKAGATGVVAINSVGPGTVIDLKNKGLLMGNANGDVWVSGPAIKPIALNRVYNIRKAYPNLPLIAAGGVETAEDLVEFVFAGADLVQMLSTALIKGKDIYDDIIEDLPRVLYKYGFESMEDVRLMRQETLFADENKVGSASGDMSLTSRKYRVKKHPIIDDRCVLCEKCIKVCPEMALSNRNQHIFVASDKCIACGLCESRCPVHAISGVLYE